MIDELVTYLIDEIAMDGDEGTPLDRLKTLIESYYSQHLPGTSQNIDVSFLTYIADVLRQSPQIRIGFLKSLKQYPELHPDSKNDARKDLTHVFVSLSPQEKKMSTATMLSDSTNELRVAVDHQVSWFALTGSHAKPNKLTPKVWQILQSIARNREDGKTMVQLGKEFTHDQKSLFHFTKVLIGMDLIAKIPFATENQVRTSLLIHTRYVKTSIHYQKFKEKDPGNENGQGEQDTELRFTPISLSTIVQNAPLVKSRIIRLLKASPNYIYPQRDIHRIIGLSPTPEKEKKLTRAFKRLLNGMVITDRTIEKVTAKIKGSDAPKVCLHLLQSNESSNEVIREGDDDTVPTQPFGTISIENQIIEFLFNTGFNGVIIKEVSWAVGFLNIRTVDTMLNRMEEQAPSPSFEDLTVRSVREVHNKEQRRRYLSLQGYIATCKSLGLNIQPGPSGQEYLDEPSAFVQNPDLVGGFDFAFDASQTFQSINVFDERITAKFLSIKKTMGRSKVKKASSSSSSGRPKKRGRPPVPKESKAPKIASQPPRKTRRTSKNTPVIADTSDITEQGPSSNPTQPPDDTTTELKEEIMTSTPVAKKRSLRLSLGTQTPAANANSATSATTASTSTPPPHPESDANPASSSGRPIRSIRLKVKPNYTFTAEDKGNGNDIVNISDSDSDSEPEFTVVEGEGGDHTDDDDNQRKRKSPDKGKQRSVTSTPIQGTRSVSKSQSPSLTRASFHMDETKVSPKFIPKKARKVERVNASDLQRQKILGDILDANGGIVDYMDLHNKFIAHYKTNDNVSVDRVTYKKSVSRLISEGGAKQITVTTDTMGRVPTRNIVFRPYIKSNSPEMSNFVLSYREKTQESSLSKMRHVGEIENVDSSFVSIVDDNDQPANVTKLQEGQNDQDQQKQPSLLSTIPPSPDIDQFKADWRSVSVHYGGLLGVCARARELHLYLVKNWSTPEPDKITTADSPIFTEAYFIRSLPFHVYMKVITHSVLDDTIENAWNDPSLRDVRVGDLDVTIRSALGIGTSKPRSKIRHILDHLRSLNIISTLTLAEIGNESAAAAAAAAAPIVSVSVPTNDSGIVDEDDDALDEQLPDLSTMITTDGSSSSENVPFWQVHQHCPLYNYTLFQEDVNSIPLVSVEDISTFESAKQAWNKLETACLAKPKELPPLQEQEKQTNDLTDLFPGYIDGSRLFVNSLCRSRKWEGLRLSPKQFEYMRPVALEYMNETIPQERIKDLSDTTLAPIEMVQETLDSIRRDEEHKIKQREVAAEKQAQRELSGKKPRQRGPPQEEDWAKFSQRLQSKYRLGMDPNSLSVLRLWYLSPKGLGSRKIHILLQGWIEKRLQSETISLNDYIKANVASNKEPLPAGEAQIEEPSPVQEEAGAEESGAPPPPTATSAQPPAPAPSKKNGKKTSKNKRKGTEEEEEEIEGGEEPAIPQVPPEERDDEYVDEVDEGDSSDEYEPEPVMTKKKSSGSSSALKFTDEQDEKLLDALAIMKVRCDELGKKMIWKDVMALFGKSKKYTQKNLQNRFRSLCRKPGQEEYYQLLQAEWKQLFQAHRGTSQLPDKAPKEVMGFGLKQHLEFLNEKVDKKALRKAAKPVTKFGFPDLPSDVSKVSSKTKSSRIKNWDSIYSNTTAIARIQQLNSSPFVISEIDTPLPAGSMYSREGMLVMGTIKMVQSTPSSEYVPEVAHEILNRYEVSVKEFWSETLVNNKAIIRSRTESRHINGPEREFVYSQQYFLTYFEDQDLEKITKTAQEAIEELGETDEAIWPIAANNGESFALAQLVSEGAVDITLDMTCPAACKPQIFWDTRKMNDEDIENTVVVQLSRNANLSVLENPRRLEMLRPTITFKNKKTKHTGEYCFKKSEKLLGGNCDCNECMQEAIGAISTNENNAAIASIISVVEHAGPDGILPKQLFDECANLNEMDVMKWVNLLCSTRPTVLFWMRMADGMYLIHYKFLADWTVPVTYGETKQLVAPRYWVDIHGKVVEEKWKQACWFVWNQIMMYPGITISQLQSRIGEKSRLLLLPTELEDILSELVHNKLLVRKSLAVPNEQEEEISDEQMDESWQWHDWNYCTQIISYQNDE